MDSKQAVSFEEVYPLIDRLIDPVQETMDVPLEEALGFISAEDIRSPLDVPQFNNSAMDGWALCSEDISDNGFTLTEVGSAFAGHPYSKKVGRGECVRIMTGGEIPEGADTVVKQEIVVADGNQITFPADVKARDNVRFRGEEFKVGDVVLKEGVELHASHIGLLAVLGIANVTVRHKVRVAFFSTGDELQPIGKPLEKGHIYDSNRHSIRAMLRECGFEILDLGIVRDDPESLKAAFTEAADCADAIITSGGVSVGKADFTRRTVTELGELVDWYCKMRPGKPLALGKIKDAYFFGLPGNPTAAQVTFYMIVRYALKRLAGIKDAKLPICEAVAACDLKKKPGHTEFQRGILKFEDGKAVVEPSGTQKTGAIGSLSASNCFILLSEQSGPVRCGETVRVIPFYGACS